MTSGSDMHTIDHKARMLAFRVCVSLLALFGLSVSTVGVAAAEEAAPRGYELVSPANKDGSDVAGAGSRTRAAADGSAVDFFSLSGFGDAQATELGTDYMSVRDPQPGTQGWVTHSLTPPQDPMTYSAALAGVDPLYVGDFSPDLSDGVFSAWSPLTNDPNVANVINLYSRHDLRTPGAGSYELDSGCPLCEATGKPLPPLIAPGSGATVGGPIVPIVAGASEDSSHVLFEYKLNLTADAPAQPAACATHTEACYARVYESDNGVVRLAGILPDGSAAEISIAGIGAGASHPPYYTPHVMSADGNRVIFTVPGTEEKPGVLDHVGFHGRLYQRVDGASTVQVDASERTDCADHNPCMGVPEPSPVGERASTYQDASADGTRVLFVNNGSLTDGPSGNLYMWDANAPAGHHLRVISATQAGAEGGNVDLAKGCGVVGISADGKYVYFIALGQLVAGAPTLGTSAGLYVWHDEGAGSSLRYIGKLANLARHGVPDANFLTWGTNWALNLGKESRVSPDGKHLLFMSSSGEGLLSAHGGVDVDQSACLGGCRTQYLYDAETEKLSCASCAENGKSVADADDLVNQDTSIAKPTTHLSHALSDDGRYAFFSTSAGLVAADTNDNKQDAYVFDSVTGKVSLLSSGTDTADSFFMDASADGHDAFFRTRQRLVGWDTDQNYDLYDARVGGGLPEPEVVEACAGEKCQGPQNPPPAFRGPGSYGFTGPGNLVTPVVKTTVRSAKTRALAGALKACRKHHRAQRKKCESRARKRYAGKASRGRGGK